MASAPTIRRNERAAHASSGAAKVGRSASALLALALVWPAIPTTARAGGYEIPGGSARALGRGSTGIARADDPIMGMLNPAGWASMPNQFMVGTHLLFQKGCMDRTGTYDPSHTGGVEGVEHPEVCIGRRPADRMTLIPQLAGVARLHKRVGLGIGLDTPYGQRRMIWQQNVRLNDDGTTTPGFTSAPPAAITDDGLVPTPTRYMLVNSDVIRFHTNIGIGIKVTDWLQIGAAFGWGIAKVRFTNYTRFGATGEDAQFDQPTDATVVDWFMPRVVGSIHFIPADSIDLVFGVRWDDDVKASGTTVATSPVGIAKGDVSYRAQQPMWVTFGFRYAHRTANRGKLSEETATDDPMKREVFDLEVDVIWERNSQITDHFFNSGELAFDTGLSIPPFEEPIRVPHYYHDQLSLRVGSDYNPVPGHLAVRLGASYETRGFRDGLGFIDFLPLQRFGIHAGLSARFGAVEMTLGYAHFFTTAYDNPNGQFPQIVIGLDGPQQDVDYFVNSGRITAHADEFAWALRVVFD